MGNVLRILRRDILRLLKAPAALIVVGALMVLPSLYTWYNVVAFWNPYEATGNLAVSVVNQDAGAETELTGRLDVGDRVAKELLANDKLNFVEKDFDTAIADLEAGNTFAVYVIPEDFSECLVSPVTGQVKSPQIVYYANEKLGPVSPKITDTAASTLDQTINSMFVETVSKAAAQAIDDAIQDAKDSEAKAQKKASAGVDAANEAIDDVRSKLKDAKSTLATTQSKTETAISELDDAKTSVKDAKKLASDISDQADVVQSALASASSDSVDTLSNTVSELSEVVTKAGAATDGFATKAGTAQALADLAIGRAQPLVNALSDASKDMQTAAAKLPDSVSVKTKIQDAASSLAGKATDLQTAVDAASKLSEKVGSAAQGASDAATSLDKASKKLSGALASYSNNLLGSAAPTITGGLTQVSTACSRLESASSELDTTLGEAQTGLRQLNDLLSGCDDACEQTDSLAEGLKDDINSIASDIRLLAQSDVITTLVEGGSLNPSNISEFMGSPTKLEKVQMYHPNAYGTAMAPLFMNLTFWIGAFMLVIIFRTEVDDEGVRRLTIAQRYLSRFVLFAGIAVVQALICCVGVLALGVQVANVPALFMAAVLTALAYLSIIYALSTVLQHIGKALCIILVFAQIPGGSGLYPLELTNGFFQAIYPFLPFSYGIDALREAIGGFYGSFFARDMMVLVAIFVGMIVLGVLVAPLMSNVTRMAARQIREGDLYNGEDAAVPERPYRLSQVVNALSDRQGFRESLEQRYARFSKLYPIFIRTAIGLAIGVPVVLAVMLALDAGEKVVLLTVVLLWLVALLIFVLVVESLRNSFERQLDLEHVSNDAALKLFFNRERLVPALSDAAQRIPRFGKTRAQDEAVTDASDEEPAVEVDETAVEAQGETADDARDDEGEQTQDEAGDEAQSNATEEAQSDATEAAQDAAAEKAQGEAADDARDEAPEEPLDIWAPAPQAEGGQDA